MDERTDRILHVAIELAERDGYDAVRLRDLAAKADVALGTVYRRFASKEDILAAALEMQTSHLHEQVRAHPIPGATPEDRLVAFFDMATRIMAEHPKLAAALLRTVASGVPEISEKVMRYHGRMKDVLILVHRGSDSDAEASQGELRMARFLLDAWFATMVGWTGGLYTVDDVIGHLRRAVPVVLRGLSAAH